MAGSKKDAFSLALLQLIFNNTALANIGNTAGLQPSGVAGSFWVALFTATPSNGGAGTEVVVGDYTGYARVAVARSSAGWTCSGTQVVNAAAITFPACTGNSCTVNGFAIMTAVTGGDMLYWADLTSLLVVSNGIIPEFAAGQLVVTED